MKNLHLVVFTLLFLFAQNTTYGQTDAATLLEELDKNFFSVDMEFNMEMQIIKNDKLKRRYEMQVFKKDKKLRLDILQPSIERDRRVLNDGANLWMYLPRSSKLIKIPYKQAFLGGDASNRDILRISLVEDYDILGSLKELNGQLILRLKAKNLKTAYNQVSFYLDSNTRFPIKQEMLSLSGKIIKIIEYDDFVALGESYFPTKLTILDQLNKDSKTIFKYTDITKGTTKSDIFFTTATLSK